MFTNGEFKRVLGVLAVTLTFSGGAGHCQSINPRRYTQEEELILRRVADGKIAKFGDLPVEKRTVPADFLAQLLTGKVRGASISNEGVLIEHAVIKGRLSVAGAEIHYTAWLNDCDFESGADLFLAKIASAPRIV